MRFNNRYETGTEKVLIEQYKCLKIKLDVKGMPQGSFDTLYVLNSCYKDVN